MGIISALVLLGLFVPTLVLFTFFGSLPESSGGFKVARVARWTHRRSGGDAGIRGSASASGSSRAAARTGPRLSMLEGSGDHSGGRDPRGKGETSSLQAEA